MSASGLIRLGGEPIRFAELLAATAGVLRDSTGRAWPTMAALAAVSLALEFVPPQFGFPLEPASFTPAWWGDRVLASGVLALFTAWVIQVMTGVAGAGPARRAGAALSYAVVVTAIYAPLDLLDLLFRVEEERVQMVAWAITAVAFLACVALAGRLQLWFVALAVARPKVGPRRSWRRMRGATLSYVLLTMLGLFAAGAGAVTLGRWTGYESDPSRFAWSILLAGAGIVEAAVGTALFRWRVIDDEEGLGEVFA